ncbi:MAG TPA: flagellar basal body P-ring formation chaperone FlgA [Thermodesulfovibrionales bacterium]|jgi:flagella basal body P-ring formation protein FlgA|nr:flagellar basal body P-ring formation chaperone FlgA [Thermodesulfovibrionales bacterium]
MKRKSMSVPLQPGMSLSRACHFPVVSFILVVATSLSIVTSVCAGAQDISGLLKGYLKHNYPWAEVEINDLTLNSETPESIPQTIVVLKGPPGKTVFKLEFGNGREITATANVRAFDWIVLSRRAFRKESVLQKDDTYVTLMDVARIPKGALNNADAVVGKSLTRSIVANVPLDDSMISEKSTVKRGHKVILVAEAPGLNITAAGELKENTRVGDYVKAINLSSKKTVTGVLVDENTVRVGF